MVDSIAGVLQLLSMQASAPHGTAWVQVEGNLLMLKCVVGHVALRRL